MTWWRLAIWLACLNLGAALWWLVARPPPAAERPSHDVGVPRLVLLSERPPPSRRVLPAPVVELACLSVGPFTRAPDLRAAMATLTPLVARIQFRELPATNLRGYRVYLPPAGGREKALQVARLLSAQGVRDYYVVTAGEQRDTISLGVFRDLANAEARRDELSALGFAAVLEPRTDDGVQWWIDLSAPAGFDWRAALPGQPALQGNPVPCQ